MSAAKKTESKSAAKSAAKTAAVLSNSTALRVGWPRLGLCRRRIATRGRMGRKLMRW